MWGFFIFYKILIFINKIILTNKNLLIEDLKRIGFMMNYEPGKLVTENEKTSKNVIVENKIETLFTPKTSNDVISETTLKKAFKEVWESRQNLISEQWARLTDQIGYWKILFENLKKSGIGVKWEVANDPVKSTFMYWGPWVINKDVNKNGGWPITFTGADKKLWLFKFKGGKYAGQSADTTIIESKFINATFNLAQWGKLTGAAGGSQFANLMKTKPKSTTNPAAGCFTTDDPKKPISMSQVPAVAAQIFKDLSTAFDGAGTFEAEAVTAYKKITCKPILDAVNAKVAARGMKSGTFGTGSPINNVGDWAKDEMSDYDYDQFRTIWAGLQKLGYKAPPVNQTMRAAGVVGDVTGINALEKGAEGIQQIFTDPLTGFEKIIDAVRSFLGGVVGGVITTILDFTGIGKVVTTIGWGILLLGDIITSSVRGVVKWAEIILDIITICTTGSFGAVVGKVLKPFFGAGSSLATLVTKLSKYTWFTSIVKALQTGISKVTGMLGKAIKWIMSTSWWKKLAGTSIGKFIGSAMSKATMFFDDMTKAMVTKGGAGSQAATTQVKDKIIKRSQEKIKTQLTTDAAEDLAWAGGTELAGDAGGERAKSAVNLTRAGSKLEKDLADLSKGKKQIFTGTDPNQAKTLAKQTGALTKDTIKTVKTGSGVVAGEEEPENKTKKPVTSTLTPGQIKA